MSEDKLQSAIAKAARAEALLRDELLTGAFAGLEADYIKAWRGPRRATPMRAIGWQAVQIVGLVRDHLARLVTDGKLAQRELTIWPEREGGEQCHAV